MLSYWFGTWSDHWDLVGAEMTAKLVNISSRSDNCATWSPIQALEDLLTEIKAGNIKPSKMIIMFFEDMPDGSMKPRRWFVNISRAEEIGLTVLATQMALDEWRN